MIIPMIDSLKEYFGEEKYTLDEYLKVRKRIYQLSELDNEKGFELKGDLFLISRPAVFWKEDVELDRTNPVLMAKIRRDDAKIGEPAIKMELAYLNNDELIELEYYSLLRN